jgi:LysM repeat protein
VMFSGEFSYVDRRVAYYRVRKRDTLDNLAKAFEVDAQDIALWNQLDPNAKLISGLILRLYLKEGFDPARAILLNPDRVKAIMRLQGQTHGAKMPEGGTVGTVGAQTPATKSTETKETEKEKPKEKFYYVKKGDSLSSISTKLGVSLAKLQKANKLTAKSALKVGQRLVIP